MSICQLISSNNDTAPQMTRWFHCMPHRFILMTSQRTPIESLTCKTTVTTKNTQLYKTPTNSDAAGRVSSGLSLSVPHHHLTMKLPSQNPPYLHIFIWTHINTYSSLSTNTVHHQQNMMMMGILPVSPSRWTIPQMKCIDTHKRQGSCPTSQSKQKSQG